MNNIRDTINGLNSKYEKNYKFPTLTNKFLHKLFSSYATGKPVSVIANELDAPTQFVKEIIEKFEIESPSEAIKYLKELDSFNPDEGPKPKIPKVQPVKLPVKNVTNVKITSSIPQEILHKFKNDIDFGWSRMVRYYGPESENNIDEKTLKEEIVKLAPHLARDKSYFKTERID